MEKKYYKLSEKDQDMIEEILEKLKEACQMLKIPMFATIAIENNEESTIYNNIVNGAGSYNIELTDDQIRNHILIANNFKIIKREGESYIVPPKDKKRIMMRSSKKNMREDDK